VKLMFLSCVVRCTLHRVLHTCYCTNLSMYTHQLTYCIIIIILILLLLHVVLIHTVLILVIQTVLMLHDTVCRV